MWEDERETLTSCLPYSAPELTTQARVLTRNGTVELLICKTTPKPLNHTIQGPGASFILSCFLFYRCVSREVSSLSSRHTQWFLPDPIAALPEQMALVSSLFSMSWGEHWNAQQMLFSWLAVVCLVSTLGKQIAPKQSPGPKKCEFINTFNPSPSLKALVTIIEHWWTILCYYIILTLDPGGRESTVIAMLHLKNLRFNNVKQLALNQTHSNYLIPTTFEPKYARSTSNFLSHNKCGLSAFPINPKSHCSHPSYQRY